VRICRDAALADSVYGIGVYNSWLMCSSWLICVVRNSYIQIQNKCVCAMVLHWQTLFMIFMYIHRDLYAWFVTHMCSSWLISSDSTSVRTWHFCTYTVTYMCSAQIIIMIRATVMSHVWMSHVTYMNESCHKYEWVMSRINHELYS